MVELLAVVAVIGILSGMGYVSYTGQRQTADANKLISDAAVVNRAVALYLASGGSLDGVTAPQAILDKLKSDASAASAARHIGLNGSFLDARVKARVGTANGSQLRAVWNANEHRFDVVATAGSGVLEFELDDAEAARSAGLEDDTRSTSMQAATETAWVWDYSDPATQTASRGGATPAAGLITSAAMAATGQGFTGGTWTISNPDGRVDVNYVFREAGYNSRLALVSLEGMGPENFDLTTTAGRLAFMTELVRRVVESDRAQVIIDASGTTPGSFEQDYYFRPGDTVAAVLIPNASFDTAYSNLLGGSTGGTSFPLTSLNMGTNVAPFHQGQIASLGNSGYAIEDIPGGGDADYDDLIFTAHGLAQSEGATFRAVDPTTYYPERLAQLGRNYWDSSTNTRTGTTLQQALINAGIIGE